MHKPSIVCASLALFTVFVLNIILPLNAINMQWRLEKTTGIRYTSYFTATTISSGIACGYLCMRKGRCAVANYNSTTMACNLVEDVLNAVSDINWDAFIVVPGMFRIV